MNGVVEKVERLQASAVRPLSDTDFGRIATALGAGNIKERTMAIAADAQRQAESYLEDCSGIEHERREIVLRTTIGVLARQIALIEQAMRSRVS